MQPRLLPTSPLTQAVFIHSHVKLVFGDETFSLYNRLALEHAGNQHRQGEPGFADALVGLIGQTPIAVHTPINCALRIEFDEGTALYVLNGPQDVAGAEAFQFNGRDTPFLVEPNS